MSFPTPEYHEFEEFQNRSKKLEEIRELGINPYPAKYAPSDKTETLLTKFGDDAVGHSEDAAAGATPSACIAGRIVLFRAMGKNAFGQLQDGSGRLQIMFNRDLTKVEGLDETKGVTPIKFIEKKLDLGDIIGIEGHLFRTNRGELTLFVKKVTVLCKTLLPLPDKHSGLADKGTRYRKRWLDLITNRDVIEVFQKRSQILKIVRNYLENHGFMEVETPVLQNIYGGAEARPFATHLNSLNQDMFCRISLEIPLKKLIVGGLERVYEISKVFRNEGIDRTHNPEFTELEMYAAYMDYNDLMKFIENLFEKIAIELYGSTELTLHSDIENREYTVSMKAPWKRMTMKESIKEYGEVDVDSLDDAQLKQKLLESPKFQEEDLKDVPRGKLIANLFEELVEHHLIQPHHITDHPIETTPLCKLHRDPEQAKQGIIERFESFILGHEFTNAYTELNDPVLQRKLLLQQAEKKLAGDEEATPLDEEFIEAICQGMPPTGGLGMGIDRMVMLFTKMHSIRDVLFFPLMKPEEQLVEKEDSVT